MTRDLIILSSAFVGFLAAVVTAFAVVYREQRAARHETHALHLQVNSRLDELLELTRKSAHAAGVREGMDRPSSRG